MACALDGEKNEFSKFIKGVRPTVPGWDRIRKAVFKRDNYACVYCGRTEGQMHCDHVVPLSRHGSNELENLVTACQWCNTSKRDKTPEEWLS